MAVGWWAETFASMTATAQRALASLTGEQPSSGVLAAAAKGASAALVGDQPFTGQVAATAHPAQAALSGGMAPEGTLAATLRAALFSASGGIGEQGVLTAAGESASAALAGEQSQQGAIAAMLQRATATMVGEQPTAGFLAATGARASAALVGSQPFTGAMGAQARSATALMSGEQTQQGAIAATAAKAVASLTGTGAANPALSTINAAVIAGTSITLPAHQVGDIFVLFSERGSGTLPPIPAAGGTVPTWTSQDSAADATAVISCRVSTAVATATNHTSGTWTSSSYLAVVVLRGQNGSNPIGGHAATATQTFTPAAPAVTLSKTDGTSKLLHFIHRGDIRGAWSAPAGYTLQASTGADFGGGVAVMTKDSTTSDGSVSHANGGWNTITAAASIEILD